MGSSTLGQDGPAPSRVLISYAHDDAPHVERVRGFWLFLRANGIDARLDLSAAEQRQDWAQWTARQVRDADRILVVASPEYRCRDEGNAEPDQGRGVQWEARMIRDRVFANQVAGLQLVLPVVLPGCSAADLPLWLAPDAATHYAVTEYTVAGAEALLRVLTGQPREVEPDLGTVPDLPPRGVDSVPGPARRPLHTEVVIQASASGDGQITSAVWLGGSPLCQRQAPLPAAVVTVWDALRLPALAAAERMAEAGQRLAGMLFDKAAQGLLATVGDRPGSPSVPGAGPAARLGRRWPAPAA